MTDRYYYAESTQEFSGVGECVDCGDNVRVDSVVIDGYDIIDSRGNQRVAFCEEFHQAVTVCGALNND